MPETVIGPFFMSVGGSLAGRGLGGRQRVAEAGPEPHRGGFRAGSSSPIGLQGSQRNGACGRC
jgi:hypothetical protein